MSDPTLKHPSDWKTERKTTHSTFALAMAIAWHKRLETGVEAIDLDCGKTYDGPVVDPTGEETRPITGEQYDAMVAEAVQIFKAAQADAVKKGGKAAQVQIVPHDELHHAVILKLPAGAEAVALLKELRSVRESGVDFQVGYAAIMSQRLLWPAGQALVDLQDRMGLAFYTSYPELMTSRIGSRGADLKKRA